MSSESIVKHCNDILGYNAYELKYIKRQTPERYNSDQVFAV